MSENAAELNLSLWPKQLSILNSYAQELFYGGAAGGGKSHVARVLAILWATEIPGIQIYFFRRFADDLKKNHVEGPTGFTELLKEWSNRKLVQIVDGEIRFKWGSKIYLRSCQYERDLPRLLGPEMHVLFIEECGQFSEKMIRYMRGRLRIPDTLKIPEKYLLPPELRMDPKVPEYSFPRAIYTSNPGGIGHLYLKNSFVLPGSGKTYFRAPEDDGGMLRQFIPARLADNPSIDRRRYEANLKGLGSKELVKSLLEGDWNQVVGAFLSEFQKNTHLIAPFKIPSHWTRFVSADWGACGDGDPFAIGWFAVADGLDDKGNAIWVKSLGGTFYKVPRGTLVCYRIWYGKGLPKVTAKYVGRGISQREINGNDGFIAYRVAGGDIKQDRGTGPSVREHWEDSGLSFGKADQRRVEGWNEFRTRLNPSEELIIPVGMCPGILFFDTCEEALETVINLQHDPLNPNDAAQGEDHVPEMIRYGVMSRPYEQAAPPKDKPLEESFRPPTLDDLWAERERLRAGR